MTTSFDRREFLRRAGVTSAAAAALPAALGHRVAVADESLAPFLHGVASGDPLPTGVIIWTRVTGPDTSAVDVTWRVARDAEMTDVVAEGSVEANSARDHTVKIDVAGLAPATYYWYVFEALGKSSLVGRTKTAPSGASDRLRFGMVSCSNWQHGYFHAYKNLAARNDLDAILHLGDYVYEYQLVADGGYGEPESALDEPRPHDPPHEMVTLADYRTRHAQYKLDPDLRALHQLYPFITTWDDHEITNDSWRDGAENHDEGEGDYTARKLIASQVYDEWLPIRLTNPADPLTIFRAYSYGDLVDIIVMDTRIEGRDEPKGGVLQFDPTASFQPDLGDPEHELISEAQRTFVLDRLQNSTAQWKLVAQQVMMMQWKAGALPTTTGGVDFPAFATTPGGTPVNADAWDGYPAERSRILSSVRDNSVDGMIVLTGDIHSSWAADLAIDPYDFAAYNPLTGAGSLGVEFVCPSVTSASFYKTLGYGYRDGSIAVEELTKADNPHIKFVEGDTHGYVILDITAERVQSEWWFTHPVETKAHEHYFDTAWQTLAGDNFLTPAAAPAAEEPGPAVPPEAPPAPTPAPEPDPEPAAPLPTTGGGAAIAGAAALAAAGLLRLRSRSEDSPE